MSTPITIVQTASVIDSSYNAINQTVTLSSNVTAGNLIVVSQGSRDNPPTNIAIFDSQSNTYTRVTGSTLNASAGCSEGISWVFARVATTGSLTVIANKAGSNCGSSMIVYELANVDAAVLDSLAVTNFGTNASPTFVSNAGGYTNDLILGAVIQTTAGVTGLTTTGSFTAGVSLSATGSFFQHQTASFATTTAAAATASWTESNGPGRPWQVSGITLRGYTTAPTINSVSSTTPRKSSTLTISGANFGASQGTGHVSLGGTTCTVTSWSDTSVAITVAEGTNKYGVPVSLVLTTNSSVNTNTYTGITALLPPAGNDYVNIVTPDIFSAHRITAVADIAAGDQLEYGTSGGFNVVTYDALFNCDLGVTSFSVRAWTPSGGWGSFSTQTIDSGGYVPPADTIVVGGHKNTATVEIPGRFTTVYRVVWRNVLNAERGAPIALSGVTTLSISVAGVFDGSYFTIEGSTDGITYTNMLDGSSSPLTFSSAGTKTSTDVRPFMRVGPVNTGTGNTNLTITMIAS